MESVQSCRTPEEGEIVLISKRLDHNLVDCVNVFKE